MKPAHLSVLKEKVIEVFSGSELHTFTDGTLGAGGHAEALLTAHPELEKFFGIDQDPVALNMARERLSAWKSKTVFFSGNFIDIELFLQKEGISFLDGILLDLGVSSMQFDMPEKGFSFMHEGPLDMRMDPSNPLTAEEIVNTWSLSDLGKIFRDYGEEKYWRKAANAIVQARIETPIKTTKELSRLLESALPKIKKGIHPATLVFQALRICVNRELEVLQEVLPKAIGLLAPKGRLAVISFHSLEDRIVKNVFRFAASDKWDTSGVGGLFLDKEPEVKLITRKPIVPTEEEIRMNPRSRSAKLRVVEKIG